MKVFAIVFTFFLGYVAAAASYGGGAGAAAGGSSYGGASIPAPPCPKNYLFSCQPSLSPAPCSQPAPSYGSAGAYSDNVPTYINAPYTFNGYQGVQGLNEYGMQGYQY